MLRAPSNVSPSMRQASIYSGTWHEKFTMSPGAEDESGTFSISILIGLEGLRKNFLEHSFFAKKCLQTFPGPNHSLGF